MAWRFRYMFSVDWIAPGQGQMGSPSTIPGASNNQTIEFINAAGGQNVPGAGAGNQINAADVTTLTNAAAVDMAAQLNANLGRIQGFLTGLG